MEIAKLQIQELEMKMNNNFERLERENVVSVYSSQILVNNRTFTLSEFFTAMMTLVKAQSGWTEEKAIGSLKE
jgi:hypothetical protein